jgi:hypothetical protein
MPAPRRYSPKSLYDYSELARLCYPCDGSDESPIARVQRGSSETARCASTGDSPGHPPMLADFFSILLDGR